MEKLKFIRGNAERPADVLTALQYTHPTAYISESVKQRAGDKFCLFYNESGFIYSLHATGVLGRLLVENGDEISPDFKGLPVVIEKSSIAALRKGEPVFARKDTGYWFRATFWEKGDDGCVYVENLNKKRLSVTECIPQVRAVNHLVGTYLPVEIIDIERG